MELRPWIPFEWGAYSDPPPPTPQLLLPRFAPFAPLAWASLLHSESLPRFLLISVLMPALGIKTHPST